MMNLHAFILTHYSIWFWGILLICLLILIQQLLNWAFLGITKRLEDMSYIDEIMNIMQGISIFFAILFAVFAYFLLGNYTRVSDNVKQEISGIGNTWRIAVWLPRQESIPIIKKLYEYTDQIIEDEMDLDALRLGKTLEDFYSGWHILEELGRYVQQQNINPEIKERLLDNIKDIADARRPRIHDISLKLPLQLWVIIFLGMVLMVICMAITSCHDKRFNFIFSSLFLGMLGSLITLIVFLDRPFLSNYNSINDMYKKRVQHMLARVGTENVVSQPRINF